MSQLLSLLGYAALRVSVLTVSALWTANVDPVETSPLSNDYAGQTSFWDDPAFSSEYATFLNLLHSHLLLVPVLSPGDLDMTPSMTEVFALFTAEMLATVDLELAARTLIRFLRLIESEPKYYDRGHAALQNMVDNGLLSHVASILTLYLKHDDLPWQELVSGDQGWAVFLRLLSLIKQVYFARHQGVEAGLQGFCMRWTHTLNPLLDALLEHNDLWPSTVQPGPAESHRVNTCCDLIHLVQPHQAHLSLQSRQKDTLNSTKENCVTRSAIQLLVKIRHQLVLADDALTLTEGVNRETARMLHFLLCSLVDRHPNRNDINVIEDFTGCAFDQLIQQTLDLLPSPEKSDDNSVKCAQAQLLPLRIWLDGTGRPLTEDWVEPLIRTRLFSHIVERARTLLLCLVAQEFSVACDAFAVEITSSEPLTPLSAHLEILNTIGLFAKRYHAWDLFAELCTPEAMSVAEMVTFLGEGELKHAYWSIYLPGTARTEGAPEVPRFLLVQYAPLVRLLAARAHFALEHRPQVYPAAERKLWKHHLVAAKAWDGIVSLAVRRRNAGAADSSTRGSTRSTNRRSKSSSVRKGATETAYDLVRKMSIWHVMSFVASGVKLDYDSLYRAPPAPSEVCAAVGCLSILAPETKCADCRKVFYCNRECQRRDWKWHKPICRQNRSA